MARTFTPTSRLVLTLPAVATHLPLARLREKRTGLRNHGRTEQNSMMSSHSSFTSI
jgi:hypothetical protein